MATSTSENLDNDCTKIRIQVCHNEYFVWSPEDVFTLRSKYKIIGGLVGSLAWKPKQNGVRTLPLLLNKIEVMFLQRKGVVEFCKSSNLEKYYTEEVSEKINAERRLLHQAQVKILAEQKVEKLKQIKDTVKKSKMDFDEILSKEKSKSSLLPYENSWIQFEIESSVNKLLTFAPNINLSENEKLQLDVFTDLYAMGYYIANGHKFGGHFLVYPGDPFVYHANYIAVCVDSNKTLSSYEYASYGRLANAVKKTLLLCSRNEDGQIVYISVSWSGMIP